MSSAQGRRVVVLGLDGTPFSFIEKEINSGSLPSLAGLRDRGRFMRMKSEIPTISSVAWASFMTGKNPGEHGIFGFTDRKPGTYELYFPNYSHLKAEPFWDLLSRDGKKCCVVNVPSTYPAREINGVLVSGFVAPSLERAVYPREAFEYLDRTGYRIDVDAAKGRESLGLLLEDLHVTLEKRREAMLHFWRQESWDFFMCVFTGTDRLHHFMWRQYAEDDPVYKAEFIKYYQRIDEIVGEFVSMFDEDTAVLMMSDHGFESLKKQVYINHALSEAGLLAFGTGEPRMLPDIDAANTVAYCMDPGRIYINLEGREPGGIVSPGNEYESMLEKLSTLVMGIKDNDGTPMVHEVLRGADLYQGSEAGLGPDLVAMPRPGYDFKGALNQGALTDVSHFTGMHTYDDAMLFIQDDAGDIEDPCVRDIASLILNALRR